MHRGLGRLRELYRMRALVSMSDGKFRTAFLQQIVPIVPDSGHRTAIYALTLSTG